MTSSKEQTLNRKMIMKHYSTPENKGQIIGALVVEEHSKTCADNLKLFVQIKNYIIDDVKFQGEGCAIFMSSVDIMINQIKGKTIYQTKAILQNYDAMLKNHKFNEQIVEKLVIYKNVGKYLNRLHCAEIISLAIKQAI